MSRARIDDRLPQFNRHLQSVMSDAMADIASEITRRSKNVAPFKDGGLRASGIARRLAKHKFRVEYDIRYARFQEKGGDNRRVIRHYSTSGTGAHFLEKTGDKFVQMSIKGYFKKHARRVR